MKKKKFKKQLTRRKIQGLPICSIIKKNMAVIGLSTAFLTFSFGQPAFALGMESNRRLQQIHAQKEVTKALQHLYQSNAVYQSYHERLARESSIKLGMKIRKLEDDLGALDKKFQKKTDEEQKLIGEMKQKQQILVHGLSVLQNLSQSPPYSLYFFPGEPLDTARGGMILESLIPLLQKYAKDISLKIKQIQDVRLDIEKLQDEKKNQKQILEISYKKLQANIKRRQKLQKKAQRQVQRSSREYSRLTQKSRTIEELIVRLGNIKTNQLLNTQETKHSLLENIEVALSILSNPYATLQRSILSDSQLIRPFPTRGGLIRPVIGKVLQTFGARHGTEPPTKGIRFSVQSQTPVLAPFDGEVVFAQSFRGRGNMVIIRHQGGYYSVLLGLSQLDVIRHQVLLKGEPIGWMKNSLNSKGSLYFELRKNKRIVDPRYWITGL